ncbi:(2Fe-2S) ferredoxin domain-containing protein [Microlunatus capsulatus]|uniref:(2Fe-2S) ferredoxin n=1 Tax=Microlunatus capsulatus TaxID=99117 RepID=A0ABS4Z319_9ACTN|nr:(2Fe-2S) ferredoxin domain-containing protein [Microlunatus capsulatus]MBP2415130.1 (2Fe-2S) ferredoxin [Microlunatus capsulatus]
MPPRSRRAGRERPVVTQPEGPVLVVCRGGDCGNRTLFPGTDHVGQLRALRAGVVGTTARVLTSPCLDACEHANVVVVLPGRAGRERGGEPVWVGGVLDPAVTDDLVAWVAAGGPAVAEPPVLVDIARVRPSRQSRQELDEVLEG